MKCSFQSIDISHVNICAALDGECFKTEVFSKDMIASLLKTPYVFGYLIIIGEQAIGYALASIAGKQGDLLTIAILPDMRGKGYGRELLTTLVKEAATKGIKELFLEVRPSNISAISLYKSFGAMQTGVRENYYTSASTDLSGTGEKEDALVFTLPA